MTAHLSNSQVFASANRFLTPEIYVLLPDYTASFNRHTKQMIAHTHIFSVVQVVVSFIVIQ